MRMKIADIKVPVRKRAVNPEKVQQIADSIKVIGMLHPILVRRDGTLLAGAHRLEACKQLGMDEVEVEVLDVEPLMQELVEIDENLIRSELSYVERGEFLRRRKEIYEMLFPVAAHGGDRKSEAFREARKGVESFAEDTAKKIGVSPRTIQQDIQIAEELPPDVKETIKQIDLPKVEALELVKVKKSEGPETVREIVKKLADQPEKVGIGAVKTVKQHLTLKRQVAEEPTAKIQRADWHEALAGLEHPVDVVLSDLSVQRFSRQDFSEFLRLSESAISERGRVVIQVSVPQLSDAISATPQGLAVRWVYANTLASSAQPDVQLVPRSVSDFLVEKPAAPRVNNMWKPIVFYAKGDAVPPPGGDVISRSYTRLSRIEDMSLQVVARFTKPGEKVLDPCIPVQSSADPALMTVMAAVVGRDFIGATTEQVVNDEVPQTLSRLKYAVAWA
ncbi:MAG: ParB/RepB/Spo0J family partition protein [Methanothrix sp.]|jgi:ParB-like chromosome segregation protein Spo0J|nr:ParB/RepB/Spo0J family partition protein [Methanothrix sp.]